MAQRIAIAKPHEAGVEKFYGSGIEGYHDYHNGYLNFGLWDRAGLTYEQAAENLVHHMGTLLGLSGASRLLDIGCGMGTQDVYLARAFEPQSIVAMDVTFKHIERAQERQRRAGIGEDRLCFRHGTATDLPFTDNSFTQLLSIEAPEHFYTREKFFHEAFRVLQPGGVLACADFSLARPPANGLERGIVEFGRALWHVPKENVYGNKVFEQKLVGAGFKNVTIKNIGKLTIPGYYVEHRRPESIRAVSKVRGILKGVIGGYLIDLGVYKAFTRGLCEYVLVRAEKP